MALDGATVTAIDGLLRDVYKPSLVRQVNNNVLFRNRIGQLADGSFTPDGKYAYIQMLTGESEGFGMRSQTVDEFPQAGHVQGTKVLVELQLMYGTIQIPEQTLQRARTNRGVVVNVLNEEMASIVRAAKRDLNRQYLGNGTGVLATVSAFSNGTPDTVTVDSTARIRLGQRIDIFDGNDLIANYEAAGCEVTAILSATQFQITTASTPANGNKVYIHGNRANGAATYYEIPGLDTIVNNTGTLQGVNRANNFWFQSLVEQNDTSPADLNMKKLIGVKTKIENAPYGGVPTDLNIASPDVWNAYGWLLVPDRRFQAQSTLDAGWPALEFWGKKILAEQDAVPQTIYGVETKEALIRADLGDLDWIDRDGRVLRLAVGTSAYRPQWVAHLGFWGTLGVQKANNLWKLTNVLGLSEGTYA